MVSFLFLVVPFAVFVRLSIYFFFDDCTSVVCLLARPRRLLLGKPAYPEVAEEKIQVVVCGFARTGSSSLLEAMEILGYSVYHSKHMFHFADHLDLWVEALRDPEKNVPAIIDDVLKFGYNMTSAGSPGTLCFEIKKLYPEAKVLLTLRDDAEQFSRSYQNFFSDNSIQIVPGGFPYSFFYEPALPLVEELMAFMNVDFELHYSNSIFPWVPQYAESISLDVEAVQRSYHNFNERVRSEIPKEDLLEYRAGDGWDPLLEFLDVDVTKDELGPFPEINKGVVWKRVKFFLLVIKYYPFIFLFIIVYLYFLWEKIRNFF